MQLAVFILFLFNQQNILFITYAFIPGLISIQYLFKVLLLLIFTVHGSLKLALYTLNTERDRLKTALESDSTILLNAGSSISSTAGNMVASLRNSLNQALQQNADLFA